MTTFAYLIPLFPFISFIALIFFGKRLGHRSAWVAIGASFLSFVTAVPFILGTLQGKIYEHAFEWITVGAGIPRPLGAVTAPLQFGIFIDPLAAMMLFVVTVVGTLIIIYSVGYMHGDPRFSRFFAYLSLFMASMLSLTLSPNFIMFYMSWELVGLCSYLLIGFWFEKDSAARASKKAFITTRVGDVALFLGILLLFFTTGTVELKNLNHEFLDAFASHSQLLTVAALLIFGGAVGKSAQFPLHVWLPDAMEGPTPVSALIHSATMVAGGVYLVARTFGLLTAFPDSLPVVAVIGTLTAFMAAFFGLTQTDIKRVLAYSTISQLGFMIAALGLRGYAAGTFHLMTHAFFKALLFLGAGSVIHGTGTQDIREMGGLWKKMPHTTLTFLIASLAIAGVPPLSGFWSKDEILLAAFRAENRVFYYVLSATAAMTAFYMFRLVFLVFFRNPTVGAGSPRPVGAETAPLHHVHESPRVMTIPLWLLAVGSAVIGLPGSPWMNHFFQHFIQGSIGGHAAGHVTNPFVMKVSVALGGGGILLAAIIYLLFPGLAVFFGKIFKPLYRASYRKLWLDELYQNTVIRAWYGLGNVLSRFDLGVIDGAVNGTGLVTLRLSDIQEWIDTHIVDGIVNGVGAVTRQFSGILRRIQTGFVQNYLLILFLGILVILFLEKFPLPLWGRG